MVPRGSEAFWRMKDYAPRSFFDLLQWLMVTRRQSWKGPLGIAVQPHHLTDNKPESQKVTWSRPISCIWPSYLADSWKNKDSSPGLLSTQATAPPPTPTAPRVPVPTSCPHPLWMGVQPCPLAGTAWNPGLLCPFATASAWSRREETPEPLARIVFKLHTTGCALERHPQGQLWLGWDRKLGR